MAIISLQTAMKITVKITCHKSKAFELVTKLLTNKFKNKPPFSSTNIVVTALQIQIF